MERTFRTAISCHQDFVGDERGDLVGQRRWRQQPTLLPRAVAMVALTASLALAGCSNSSAQEETRAFTSPVSNHLDVKAPSACSGKDVEVGDDLGLSGFSFDPNSEVTLRWNNNTTDDTGIWEGVRADDAGAFTKSVIVTREVAHSGDQVDITAEGRGESGLMVLSAKVNVTQC